MQTCKSPSPRRTSTALIREAIGTPLLFLFSQNRVKADVILMLHRSPQPLVRYTCVALYFSLCSIATQALSVGIAFDDDLYLGAWSPFATFYEVTTPVCVWTDEQSVTYRIVASDFQIAAGFDLENGIGDSLPFTISWQDDFNPLAWHELQTGIPSSDEYLFDSNPQCGGSTNTQMRVEVQKADFDNAATGIYTGTIIITVLPQ